MSLNFLRKLVVPAQKASLSTATYPRIQFAQQNVIVSQPTLNQPFQRHASVLSNHVSRRNYFEWMWKNLGVVGPDDWYKISEKQLFTQGGANYIMREYNKHLYTALKKVYPEFRWKAWKFEHYALPKDYFENHVQMLHWLNDYATPELGIKELDDWYAVTLSEFKKKLKGGSTLLNRYDGSFYELLKDAYPEHNWQVWRFKSGIPEDFWEKEENEKDVLKYLEEKLEITTPEDWNKVSMSAVTKLGAGKLIRKYAGLSALLATHYPGFKYRNYNEENETPKIEV